MYIIFSREWQSWVFSLTAKLMVLDILGGWVGDDKYRLSCCIWSTLRISRSCFLKTIGIWNLSSEKGKPLWGANLGVVYIIVLVIASLIFVIVQRPNLEWEKREAIDGTLGNISSWRDDKRSRTRDVYREMKIQRDKRREYCWKKIGEKFEEIVHLI